MERHARNVPRATAKPRQHKSPPIVLRSGPDPNAKRFPCAPNVDGREHGDESKLAADIRSILDGEGDELTLGGIQAEASNLVNGAEASNLVNIVQDRLQCHQHREEATIRKTQVVRENPQAAVTRANRGQ